jgi:hypothetical protein
VIYVALAGGDVRVRRAAGCDDDAARTHGAIGVERHAYGRGASSSSRSAAIRGPALRPGRVAAADRPSGDAAAEMIAAVARRASRCARRAIDRRRRRARRRSASLEPLLPGFLSASAAMARVVEQIQRLQGNDLTVLITGESGTGKELVSRAIHVGSHRGAGTFLPYNCTTTGRDLADSQLFGHRRGSFTGAVADQPGLIRTGVRRHAVSRRDRRFAAGRPAEAPALPRTARDYADRRDQAAARRRPRHRRDQRDLEQRVAEGKFREDLYYRLSVIRIHVPPLRERREEIPHLSTFFLREAIERLGKPDIHLGSETLDVFSQYWWPGNVRQLKNEIQRAVALSAPRRHNRSGAPVAGHRHHAPPGVRFDSFVAIDAEPRVRRRTGRTGTDSGCTRSRGRQHLGVGPRTGADPSRPLSENPAARARRARRVRYGRGYLVSCYRCHWILSNLFAQRFKLLHCLVIVCF